MTFLRLTLTSKTNTEITWGITLVLMFRSVGSILFGIAADRYGRKWPFIVNNILFIILELVSFLVLSLPQNKLSGQAPAHVLGCGSMNLAKLNLPMPRCAPGLGCPHPRMTSRVVHRSSYILQNTTDSCAVLGPIFHQRARRQRGNSAVLTSRLRAPASATPTTSSSPAGPCLV